MSDFDLTDTSEYISMVQEGVNKLLPIVTPTTVAMQGPGGPSVAPEWLVSQLARIQAEVMSLKLEMLVLNAALSVSTMDLATSQDEQVTEIFRVAKERMGKFVEEAIQAQADSKAKAKPSRIIRPNGTQL